MPTATGPSSPIVVPGLTPGGTYRFTVAATSAAGRSAASVPSAPVVLPGPGADPPAGADALQRRTLAELRGWQAWLTAGGVRGYVGEFGVPATGDSGDIALWNALLDLYYSELDRTGMNASAWSSGRAWGLGYPLGIYVGVSNGDITNSTSTAATVEAHLETSGSGIRGTALSGFEFPVAAGGGGVRVPWTIVHSPADFAYLAARGVRTVRVGMAWERMQPVLKSAFDPTALAGLDAILTGAAASGVRVVLDLHNYGRYTAADDTTVSLIRDTGGALDTTHLVDFWQRMSAWVLAAPARSATVLGYGLMNEPHDLAASAVTGRTPAQVWEFITQQVLGAVRASGDRRLVTVSGYEWSHVHDWATNHPIPWIADPADNVVYEGHHYWDTTSSAGSRSGTYVRDGGALPYATELSAAASDGF